MIDRNALRLAAVVVAHGNPRCNVLSTPHSGNVLVGYCWATYRDGREEELLAEPIVADVPSVRAWLGY